MTLKSPQSCGVHVIIEVWDANHLNNKKIIKKMIMESIEAAGATLIHFYLHQFKDRITKEPTGITAVAVLSESHFSLHSYPHGSPEIKNDRSYCAIDCFTCGSHTDPRRAIAVIKKYLETDNLQITELSRGIH